MNNCDCHSIDARMSCPPKASLQNKPVAMAYVPWQYFNQTYEPDQALMCGTIFPELNKPFLGKRGACER